MAKFCRYCGTQLADDARFCRTCGADLSAAGPQQPAANPGVVNTPPAANRPVVPTPQVQNRAAVSPQAAANQKTAGSSPAAKPGKRGLSLGLVVVLVVGFLFAGLKYPGFLRGGGGGGTEGYDGSYDGSYGGNHEGSNGGKTESTADAGSDTFYTDTDDVKLRYTKEQIASAPAQTAEVSPWETKADFGAVSVELDSWSLDEDDDQLTVRELPELVDDEEELAIRAYDFSLASGQHEFPTDITITIPRDGTDVLPCCVWFDEENDRWEEIFFEVSEDGRNYIISADHFSLFGVKSYRFDMDSVELVESNGHRIGLDNGVFVEVQKRGKNRMCWPVKISYDRMFNLYQKKSEEDIKNLETNVKSMFSHSDHVAENENTKETEDTVHNFFGYINTGVGYALIPKDANDYIRGKEVPAEWGPEDKIFLGIDVFMTTLKIMEDAKRGNYTPTDIMLALPSSIVDNFRDIADIGVTVLTTSTMAPWVAGLVGLAWWTGGQIYDMPVSYSVKIDPTLETLHQYYCSDRATRMVYGEQTTGDVLNSNKRTICMKRPASMTEEDFKYLKKQVEKKPLRRYASSTFKSAESWYDTLFSDEDGNAKMKYEGWSEALGVILTTCADDGPVYLENVLDEFYRNYAYAFWELDDADLDQIAMTFYSSSKERSYSSIKEVNKDKPVTAAVKLDCAEKFAQILKQETKPILFDIIKTMQTDNCQNMMREMEKEILPLLNCQVAFHVVDENLPTGASFQDSLYCKDWTVINANHYFANGTTDKLYNDPSFVTPMRFDGVTEALFLPLLPSDELLENMGEPSKNRKENYYPYTADFVPQANTSDDVVYRCSYYHYLMMGAPKTMIFKDVSNPSAYADAKEVKARIKMPVMIDVTTQSVNERYTGREVPISVIVPLKQADFQVIIPQASGAVYKLKNVEIYQLDNTGLESEYLSFMIEKALADTELTVGSDGSFYVYGSATETKNNPRESVDNSMFSLELEEDPVVWTESSIYDNLTVELSGTCNLKEGTGSATMTGSHQGYYHIRDGHESGKVDSVDTDYSSSLNGSTAYITVSNSGKEIYIRFMNSDGTEGSLGHSHSTSHSSPDEGSRTDTGTDMIDVTIVYSK